MTHLTTKAQERWIRIQFRYQIKDAKSLPDHRDNCIGLYGRVFIKRCDATVNLENAVIENWAEQKIVR